MSGERKEYLLQPGFSGFCAQLFERADPPKRTAREERDAVTHALGI